VVGEGIGRKVDIVSTPTDDNRSYRVSSNKICRELGFVPARTIGNAVESLVTAFTAGKVPNPMTDKIYYNIKTMQAAGLI
jgi:hypothetical protein